VSDPGGAVLLAITGGLMVYVAEMVKPLNRPSEMMRWAILCLAGSIWAVAGIYAAFALDLSAGLTWRPYLKIADGILAALSAHYFAKVLSGRTSERRPSDDSR
jgi:hypothetical protein